MRFGGPLLCVALCLAGPRVAADPASPPVPAIPERKSSVDGYPARAREDFLEAMLAERRGDYQWAIAKYQSSLEHSKQANTWFNYARLELRLDMVRQARNHFRYYLDAAPQASDRVAIEKLIDALDKADPIVTIGGEVRGTDAEPDAVVLLDGVLVGRSPVTIRVLPGAHEAERITATTYGNSRFTVRAGDREYVDVIGRPPKRAGNVILSGVRDGAWTDGSVTITSGERAELRKGKYKLVRRGPYPGAATCTPVAFEVASTAEVTYVRVELGKSAPGSGCTPVVRTTVQRLKVGP